MTETGRSYQVIKGRDEAFSVEILPSEEDAPLIISGFSSEAEALAWIDGQRK